MQCSVIICTYNRASSLAVTLKALGAIAGPGELIVVDNGSTDDTAQVVRDAQHETPIPVRYVRENRRGKSAALNAGVAAAAGDVIAFTDDDAIPHAQWLTELIPAFRAYRCDWVFGRVQPSWARTEPVWFSPQLNGIFALLDFGPTPFVVTERQHAFFGVNCAARRDALVALGPFREDLGPTNSLGGGGEDTEMFERALAAGQKIVYLPAAVVAHVIPEERAKRQFHRRRMLNGRHNNYRFVAGDRSALPRILAIPRYQYLLAMRDFITFSHAKVRGDASTAFHHELRLIRFGGLLQQAVAHKLKLRSVLEARATTGGSQ